MSQPQLVVEWTGAAWAVKAASSVLRRFQSLHEAEQRVIEESKRREREAS